MVKRDQRHPGAECRIAFHEILDILHGRGLDALKLQRRGEAPSVLTGLTDIDLYSLTVTIPGFAPRGFLTLRASVYMTSAFPAFWFLLYPAARDAASSIVFFVSSAPLPATFMST